MPRLLLLASALALLAPAAAHAANPQLLASVGPGFTISLTDAAGARVTHLDPGTYDVVVDDQAEEHDFHLQGPGVDRFTDVSFVGKVTWTVTLADGVYTFKCDPHASALRGSFTVGSGGTPTTPTPAPAPAAGVKLTGTVGPGFTISLRNDAGKAVKTLQAGPYTIVVRDRSKRHDFHLRGAGASKTTTVPFIGTVTWKVTLSKGTLKVYCDAHATSMVATVRVS